MFPTERFKDLRIPTKNITTIIDRNICKIYPDVESYLWCVSAIYYTEALTINPTIFMIVAVTPAKI